MITLLQSIFLGLVQGLAEFLPISSSGHLAIFQSFFGVDEAQLFFDVMLHLGTLLAVLVFFRRDIAALVSALAGREASGESAWSGSPADARKFVLWVLIGTIPAGLAGYLFEDRINAAFGSVALVGGDLLVTGAVLAAADRVKGAGRKAASMGIAGALIIGVAQAIAILPGISRSGATICAALFLGMDRKESARFSFLLAIPAIAGAAVLKLKDVLEAGAPVNVVPVTAGMAVAFVSGLLALQWLIHVLNRGRLTGFAFYCWLVGAAAIICSFFLH